MGWLWSSSSSSPAATPTNTPEATKPLDSPPSAPPAKRDYSLSDDQRHRIFGRAPPSLETRDSPTQAHADKSLEAFLNSFEPSTTPPNSSNPTPASPSPADYSPEPAPPPPPPRLNPDGTTNIHPTALYSRTMSCRQAFDHAFYCQSLGGKFNSLYRYGRLEGCSEQWGAFWFCMRIRTMGQGEGKEAAVRGYYAEREARRRGERGAGSEEVWGVRTRAVERAFQRDPDEVVEEGVGMEVEGWEVDESVGDGRSWLAQYSRRNRDTDGVRKASEVTGVPRILLIMRAISVGEVTKAANGKTDAVDVMVSRAMGALQQYPVRQLW
ncbi:hypothetical protein LTR87_010564 [Friedmanniomyces endolithicus]|nr:hypothetical protein LTR87_010564 [Friedmanniomyces endolithicus]